MHKEAYALEALDPQGNRVGDTIVSNDQATLLDMAAFYNQRNDGFDYVVNVLHYA